jgi:uncharacterized protein
MTTTVSSWTITNDHGLDILGDSHIPNRTARGQVLLLHGFKGYKDYGFIPILAHDLCNDGLIVHRFNFSTSGMTNEIDTFARADLFELDSWSRQVDDVMSVIQATRDGTLSGSSMPTFLVGHSRGGATALLTGGRHHNSVDLKGVVTINAVDRCCRMSEQEQSDMLERGYTVTSSARTNQDLRIGSSWLSEQLDEPSEHDVLLQAGRINCPMLVTHGDADEAVDIQAGKNISDSSNGEFVCIEGGNHVLNMPNPSTVEQARSAQLEETIQAIKRFVQSHSEA